MLAGFDINIPVGYANHENEFPNTP